VSASNPLQEIRTLGVLVSVLVWTLLAVPLYLVFRPCAGAGSPPTTPSNLASRAGFGGARTEQNGGHGGVDTGSARPTAGVAGARAGLGGAAAEALHHDELSGSTAGD
jgi:hypothetical protein